MQNVPKNFQNLCHMIQKRLKRDTNEYKRNQSVLVWGLLQGGPPMCPQASFLIKQPQFRHGGFYMRLTEMSEAHFFLYVVGKWIFLEKNQEGASVFGKKRIPSPPPHGGIKDGINIQQWHERGSAAVWVWLWAPRVLSSHSAAQSPRCCLLPLDPPANLCFAPVQVNKHHHSCWSEVSELLAFPCHVFITRLLKTLQKQNEWRR